MKPSLFRFYSGLIFLYFSDMSLLIATIWLSYQLTESALFLSAMLGMSAILSMILSRFKFRINLLALSLPQLMQLRVGIYIILLLLVFCLGSHVVSLILFAFLVGILSVTILSSYEAKNSQLVLEKQIDKSLSARIMQTVIQIGAFAGSMLGSFMLSKLGFQMTVLIIALLDITVCLGLYFTEPKKTLMAQNDSLDMAIPKGKKQFTLIICALLGLVGLHISTFNLTLPIIFQTINQWEVVDFGLASAMAGVGSFVAVFFKHNSKRYILLLLVLVLSDILLTFNSIKSFIMPLGFLVGFAMNSIRIGIREKLIGLAENHQQATYISGLSASYYLLFQSVGTLFLGLLLELITAKQFILFLLPFIAIVLSVNFVFFYFKEPKNG